MKILLLFYILALASLSIANGQINKHGLSELQNYTIKEYEGEEQNWSIVQDKRGVYYIGKTSEGIMEYDGTNWTKIPVPNTSMIRALAVGNDGMVYVGAIGEIGRLKPDKSGTLNYESLLPYFRDTVVRNKFASDVWKVYNYKNQVLFATRQHLAFFDGDSVSAIYMGKSLSTGNFMTFVVDDNIYIGSFTKGLHKLVGDTIEVVPNSEILIEKNIFAIVEYNKDTLLIATAWSEFYLFDPKSNEFKPWTLKGDLAKYIDEKGAMFYSGIKMANGNFAFGYVEGGKCSFIEVNKKGEVLSLLNTELGLNDESVTFLFQESSEYSDKPILWLTLNNGIANLDISSQIKKFDEINGLNGIILDVIDFEGRIYVATMSGLFASTVDELGVLTFKQIDDIPGLTWTLLDFKDPKTGKNILLAGTGREGVFEVKGYRAKRIFKDPARHTPPLTTKKIIQSKKQPNRVYIALEGGFTWMDYVNGSWITTNVAFNNQSLRGDFRSIVEDHEGNVWIGSYLKGVFKLEDFDITDTLNLYSTERGLPAYCGQLIVDFDDKVYFGADDGLYEYDKEKDLMVQTDNFGGLLKGRHVHRIVKTPNGYAMADASEEQKAVEIITKKGGEWSTNSYPFKIIPNTTADALYVSDTLLYIGASTTLYVYNLNDTLDYTRLSKSKESYDVLLRKIIAGDSLLYGGAFYEQSEDGRLRIIHKQSENNIPQIEYVNNSLNIEWSALWFLQPEKTQYSYMLEGYRDQWSNWSSEYKKDFTNLNEGYYTFHVKARNVYGVESNVTQFSFKILPPWYRTIYAFVGYVLLLLFFVIAIVKIYTRRLIAEKERLERIVAERTAEVVAQKEEIEAQSEKIFQQNEHIKSSINYASKIQNAVLSPDEVITRIFNDYFILYLPRDIVSGDFYWVAEIRGLKYCAVADCTGHGVPGGFMSMMGMSFLNQIIGQDITLSAGEILNHLRENIIRSLHQTGKVGENKDGMDIALYIIDPKTNVCQFAGANNPLVIVRNNEAIVYKPDKMPVGIYVKGDQPFETQEIILEDGDVLYTFSDGYVDQFGGPDKRKFMSKRFRELLVEIHKEPMEEQHRILDQTLLEWHEGIDRVDDVVVMGYRHRINGTN